MPDPGPFETAFAPGKRDAPPLGQLSNMPTGKGWDEYVRLMQAMTGPKIEGGPAARRAEGGMPAGPRPVAEDVQLQEPGALDKLLAFLTKPRITIGMAGGK